MDEEAIIDAAQDAFWDVVAKAHPEITTGDFPPDAHVKFSTACRSAVRTWVESNSQPRV